MSEREPSTGRSVVTRAFQQRGRVEVRPLGVRPKLWEDLYHRLMQLSWPRLGLLSTTAFFLFNLLFAALYRLDPQGLAMPQNEAGLPLFWHDFFFSVHTVATIGYGNVYPVSAYANWLVVAEITLGILSFALVTGLAFARFSRPTSRLLFSEVMVVRDIDGVPTLMLRAANQRHNLIYSAHAQLSLIADSDVAGVRMRRFIDLPLERGSNPVFALSWTIMHPIDEASPLRKWIEDPASAGDGEIVVVLSGFDESSGQTIHGRWAYGPKDIRWNARFADIIDVASDGVRTIDYGRFHTVEDL
jgi:inward rectifier potassium channel